jgi:hypothetical protein
MIRQATVELARLIPSRAVEVSPSYTEPLINVFYLHSRLKYDRGLAKRHSLAFLTMVTWIVSGRISGSEAIRQTSPRSRTISWDRSGLVSQDLGSVMMIVE